MNKAKTTKPTSPKTLGSLYGFNFMSVLLLNRLRYKGKGRPRKTDYLTLDEAQKQINSLRSHYLDYIHMMI